MVYLPSPPVARPMPLLKNLLLRLISFAQRHPGLLALFGFASGLASFILIERSEQLAQGIAAMMLVSWIWLTLEQTLRQGVLSRFGLDLPPALIRFATQMVHQESFFFVLPFFFAATYWDTGQVAVIGLLGLCALVSLIDPLYFRVLAPRRTLFVIFHALALFATLLVSLPIILQLTTSESFIAALGVALLLTIPGLKNLFPDRALWRVPVLALMLLALAYGTWQLRFWVPAVPMRLAEVSVTHQVDTAKRIPGVAVDSVDANTLHWDGLYAWTAIRVPRGLRETVYHVWIRNGTEVDRIPMTISGGREQGYRAWSHKLHFPADPVGNWQVQVVTGTGQMIGMVRFTVTGSDNGEWSAPAENSSHPR
jgi:hypothetical protein